jgi:predicted HAD superfamily Cof-like phosphohydrolase
MDLASILLWHQRARPNPSDKNFNVQLGCHFEEIHEMLAVMSSDSVDGRSAIIQANVAIKNLADRLKSGSVSTTITDRREFLDSLGDQIVTGVGVGHTAGMKIVEATDLINQSNWSKFTKDGQPIFNANGKIMKNPETYSDPDLSGLF